MMSTSRYRALMLLTVLAVVTAVGLAAWALVTAAAPIEPGPLNLGVRCGSVLRPNPPPAGLITDCGAMVPAARSAVLHRGEAAAIAFALAVGLGAVGFWRRAREQRKGRRASLPPE